MNPARPAVSKSKGSPIQCPSSQVSHQRAAAHWFLLTPNLGNHTQALSFRSAGSWIGQCKPFRLDPRYGLHYSKGVLLFGLAWCKINHLSSWQAMARVCTSHPWLCLVPQKASLRSEELHHAPAFGQSQQLTFNLWAQMKKPLAELIAFQTVFFPTKLPQPVGRLGKSTG